MSDRKDVVVTLVTAPDQQTAQTIGRQLLEERLVACVNIVPGIRSMYWWQGVLEDDEEVLMLLKAPKESVQRIAARVKELHPYSVPEVIATEIVGGLAEYLEWIHTETDRPNGDD